MVNEDYDTSTMPGWESGSVGYHIDDGIIFHDNNEKETEGILKEVVKEETL